MSDDTKISYEDYIPTDKWSLQDWYLMKMVLLERLYNRLMRGLYGGGEDRRALIEFYAEARGYYKTAHENFKKHLDKKQQQEFLLLVTERPDNISIEKAEQLMDLISIFHWESGLSKLSESRPLGEFAYARQKLGLDPGDKEF